MLHTRTECLLVGEELFEISYSLLQFQVALKLCGDHFLKRVGILIHRATVRSLEFLEQQLEDTEDIYMESSQ